MGLPGHRRTSSHKNRRAAHFALKIANATVCPKCKHPVMPHHACAFCGTYRGRQVFNVDKRTSRSTRRAKAKKA
ncbi:MAG: 50S ribosomal protein L32 [Patescibacteria group bacterium]